MSLRTILAGVATLTLIAVAAGTLHDADKPTEKHKRQIYREQVLPHRGGKIPSDAFRSDRLALNRLNKDGISVPDGVLLDARRHDRHPHSQRDPDREMSVIKLVLTPDGRYTPVEGRYHDEDARTIDSTYIIRTPIDTFQHGYRKYPKNKAYLPIPTKLELPAKTPKTQYWNRKPKNLGFPPPEKNLGFRPPEKNLGFRPSENFGFQHNQGLFSDYYHPYYTPQSFATFESFFDEFNNGRFARQTAWKPVRFPTEVIARSKSSPSLLPVTEDNVCGDVDAKEEKMIADLATLCQTFHVCRPGGRRDVFHCSQGMLFNEASRRCDWKTNVICK